MLQVLILHGRILGLLGNGLLSAVVACLGLLGIVDHTWRARSEISTETMSGNGRGAFLFFLLVINIGIILLTILVILLLVIADPLISCTPARILGHQVWSKRRQLLLVIIVLIALVIISLVTTFMVLFVIPTPSLSLGTFLLRIKLLRILRLVNRTSSAAASALPLCRVEIISNSIVTIGLLVLIIVVATVVPASIR